MSDTYLLLENGVIAAAGGLNDWVPIPGMNQSVQKLADVSIDEFWGRFQLSTDKQTITADGIDTALISVTTNLQIGSLALRFEWLDDTGAELSSPDVVNVPIINGVGIEPLTVDNPCFILITPDDRTQYLAGLVVEAK